MTKDCKSPVEADQKLHGGSDRGKGIGMIYAWIQDSMKGKGMH